MAQNQWQILIVVALIIVISANNITQAFNINPDACTTLVKNLISQELVNNDPEGAMRLIMIHFDRDQCLEDASELNQECLNQVAMVFLKLVKNNPENFEITPEQISTTIDHDSELSNVCPST